MNIKQYDVKKNRKGNEEKNTRNISKEQITYWWTIKTPKDRTALI